jgi:predicted metal-dependent peptidase
MQNSDSAKACKENISKDMAINQLITAPGCWSLPENCVFHNKKPFDYPAKMSAEEYYMMIEKDFTDEEIQENYRGMDDHSQWGEDTSPEEAKNTIKGLAKAYADTKDAMKRGKCLEHSKGIGWMPGDMLQSLLSIETPDIMWQSYVKMFMQKVLDQKKRFSYKKFSRRYGAPFQGTVIKTKSKICAIVDTSGSMSDSFLAHIGGQLNLMSRIMQVDVVFCDAAVQGGIAKFKPTSQLSFPGRGGTDMGPAFAFAEENLYRGIVCFTDGGLFSTPQSKIPTLWVVVNNSGFKQPFGEICYVEWKD